MIGKIAEQLEESNLASSLELDVLVHVEEEHEVEEKAGGGEDVPHLFRILINIISSTIIRSFVAGFTVLIMISNN